MTLTLVAERLAVELLLPIFTTYFYSVTTGGSNPDFPHGGERSTYIRKKEEICKLPIMNPLPLLRDYLPLNEHASPSFLFPTILVK